jgi:hypothetical protein
MKDPWDDLNLGTGGLLITPSGTRIPVSVAGAPLQPAPAPSVSASAAAVSRSAAAGYAGVGPKGYRRSDQRVREEICERLLLDPYLDASNVAVAVSKGRVSLKGTVPSERMHDGVIAAAERVAPGAVRAELRIAGTAAGGTRASGQRKRRRTPAKRRTRGGNR